MIFLMYSEYDIDEDGSSQDDGCALTDRAHSRCLIAYDWSIILTVGNLHHAWFMYQCSWQVDMFIKRDGRSDDKSCS